jgi:hypothetical protein
VPGDEKDRLADALRELSGAPRPQPDPDAPRAPVVRPLAPERKPPPPLVKPASLDPHSAHGEASGLDQIVDDGDLVAVPAPSEDDLLGAAMRRVRTSHRAKPRAMSLQRTLIPILLTLSVLLPAFGAWMLLRPDESELRLYGQRLMIYLLIGGGVFLVLAIVNMIQVRSSMRATNAQAPVR